MIRRLSFVAGIAIAGIAGAAESSEESRELVKRGEYLAVASDCTACHSAPHGKPFAGGLAITTPIGTIYSTNITPSAGFGIGDYTEEEFSKALRRGVRRDGAQLYSAMPYTSYAKLTDDDVHALYAFLLHGVKPVDERPPRTELPFPLSMRASMIAWNFLFLDTKVFTPDAQESAQWNRGAYLTLGAAHCSTCHTPRGVLMQEQSSRALSGARVGPWFAPNITSDLKSGIGSWTKEELVAYLSTGRILGKTQAAGSMGEAVEHSFQHLTSSDLDAVATYVKSVPAIHDPVDDESRFHAGAAFSEVASTRGRGGTHSDSDAVPNGAELFQGNCASCHAVEGQGSKDGYYPSLFHNSATGAKNATNLVAAILYGVERSTSKGQAFMPGFGGHPTDANPLSNRDIAALANYVLVNYGSGKASITEEQVAEGRQEWPSSPLLSIVRAAMATLALLVLVGVVLTVRRAFVGR